MSKLTIERGLGSAAPLVEIGEVRRSAWGPIVGDAQADQRFGIDGDDHHAWHLYVTESGVLVAAGRLVVRLNVDELPEPKSFGPWTHRMTAPLGFASRLAVRPSHQGKAIAEPILAGRIALARELGLTQVWGETRAHHVHGLERHGYRVVDESRDDTVPGDWHIMCAPLG